MSAVLKTVIETTRTGVHQVSDTSSDLTPTFAAQVVQETTTTTTNVILTAEEDLDALLPISIPRTTLEIINLLIKLIPADTPFGAIKEFAELVYKEYGGESGKLTVLEFEDVLLAIYIYSWAQYRAKEGMQSYLYPNLSIREILDEFQYWMPFATAAYGRNAAIAPESIFSVSDIDWTATHTRIPEEKIVRFMSSDPTKTRLPHYVLVNDAKKAIVVGIRGTLPVSDPESVMADLRCGYEAFELPELFPGEKFMAHRGILEKGRNMSVDPALISAVKESLLEHPDYSLVICGHSLGGGTAGVLSVFWAKQDETGKFVTNSTCGVPGRDISCITFAAAAPFDHNLTQKTQRLAKNFVNENDIVSSLSYGALQDLHSVAIKLKADPKFYSSIIVRILLDGSSRANAKSILADLREITKAAKHLKMTPPGKSYGVHTHPETREFWGGYYTNSGERFFEVRWLPGCVLDHLCNAYTLVLERKPLMMV